ncbi:GNAT family N-acetyltransferase [Staphylococcus auricularis]|uniref:GNAT family N-acetyltransferase n=1 Tax=Staphylococcus auricularis TaxID=29379 RepID=UPI003EBCF0B7
MIRKATFQDLDSVLDLVEEAKAKMRDNNNTQWDDDYPLDTHFKKDIETDTLFVIDDDGEIYGFIVIDQQQADWYDKLDWPIDREGAFVIHRLASSSDYKGGATELFNFAIDHALEHQIHVILTDTFALNKPAQGLFEKFGFTKVGEAEIDYHPFDKGEPFYAYYKTIEE